MISQSQNRVQAIKSKFENLNNENTPLLKKNPHLCKQKHECASQIRNEKFTEIKQNNDEKTVESDSSSDDCTPKPNTSYLYSKNDIKRTYSDAKTSLSRQISDPGKKLHRSHAFRCDRSQISPKRHGSCNGRSETSDFTLKPDKKLSKERLKMLGHFLEEQMKKENFTPPKSDGEVNPPFSSIPDDQVPQDILDQYAKVIKPKKKDEAMTDSGVSSETENLDDDKSGRIKKLVTQFQKTDVSQDSLEIKTNLKSMDDLAASSDTIKLERKNPHLTLTDTLKKALKQPLPPGPPPKKPPRTFTISPITESPENTEQQKKDPKKMLEKLEQVLERRKAQNQVKNVDESSAKTKKPKEIHYLCTEILDITQRTLLPNNADPISRCFNSLNCAISNSTSSLPYTRLSSHHVNETCPCSHENSPENNNFSTFLSEKKCLKCQVNDEKDDRFKCHLKCKCNMEKSEFFITKEHIYDEPYIGDVENVRRNNYGSLNSWKNSNHSKSMEDLRMNCEEVQQIYDIPCDTVRPESSDPEILTNSKIDFEKLRRSFESGCSTNNERRNSKTDSDKTPIEKPKPLKLKPILLKMKASRSTENLVEDTKYVKRNVEKKFSTETKRYRNRCEAVVGFNLPKRESAQLDTDRENLNRLMNEIYETVTAVCNMDENKPGSFPTDQSDGSTSEDSVKLTRSLTEKRKNYVRRVSSRVAYLDPKNIKTPRFRHQTSICSFKSEVLENPYSTFRSWKSFRTSQGNLMKDKMDRRDSTDSKFNLTDSSGNILSLKMDFDVDSVDKLSIDEKTGCVDIGLPFEVREKGLFDVCLLVGLNYMTGQAYVKSVFPSQVQVPPHIENLIFPETLSSSSKGEWTADAKGAQCYSLVLTDERGERSYGYCRRVLPEGATTCLPLCYCLIGRYRAPGFYYKVLQEIESHHGSSDVQIHSILQQLYETDLPYPGEHLTITHANTNTSVSIKTDAGTDGSKSMTMPDMRRSEGRCDFDDAASFLPDFYDLENNNGSKKVTLSLDGRKTKTIKRPIEPRVDEDNLSILLDLLGAGLVIKVFGSLLLERKVVIMGDKLSSLSSCLEALQGSLYPFVWQQPLISAIPAEIQREVLEAPLPILAGMLKTDREFDTAGIMFEEGMLIDLSHPSKVLFYQGDESTILPTSSYKTLKTSLQMESSKHKDRQEDTKTRNVMISEAFMRFFVDIMDEYTRHFHVGLMKDGDMGKDGVIFDKEAFIKQATSKQNQYFLEWFTETAMFNHFIQNMASRHRRGSPLSRDNNATSRDTQATYVDTPLPNFYELFDERVMNISKFVNKSVDGKSNYKNAVNKKVRLLKNKLRDLVA